MPRRLGSVGAARAVAATLLASLSACGGAASTQYQNSPGDHGSLWGQAEAVRPPLSKQEVQALVELVAETRGLPAKKAIVVERVASDHVANMLHSKWEKPEVKAAARDELRLLVALNMAPASVTNAPRTVRDGGTSLLQSELLGYYDPDTKRVYFRGTGNLTADQEFHERLTLAHEVQHALQDQHFGLPDLSKFEDDDALLAYKALSEGDATVTGIAYIGAEEGIPLSRMMYRVSDADVMRYNAEQSQSEAMKGALPFVRNRLEFPYLEGTSFASALVRAGRFKLLNRAFKKPPTTTEQVLHPRKYLRDEQPDVFPSPRLPAGFEELSSAPLGEFQMRLVLERCVTKGVARRAAWGWGGDLLTLAKRADGALAVLWNTSWDTENDAREFAEAIDANPDCWPTSESDELRVAVGHAALRRGKRVAFVRGLPSSAAGNAARGMFAASITRARAKPLGSWRIPKLRTLPRRRPGLVKGTQYRSDWLGLTSQIPQGVNHEVHVEGDALDSLELTIERQGTLLGMLGVYDRIANPAFDGQLVNNVLQGLADVIQLKLQHVSAAAIDTPLGPAKEWVSQVVGSAVQTRIVLVPICEGTGSLVFVHVYFDAYAHTVLDGWMASFRRTNKRRPAICGALNPL
jgi:hypothetical protein